MTTRIPNLGKVGFRWPGSVRGRQTAQLWYGTGTALADICAALVALAAGAAVVGRGSGSSIGGSPDTGSEFIWSNPLAVTALLFGAVILTLAQQGQYSRRQPFWSSLGEVVTASAAGLAGSLFVLLALRNEELLVPVAAWVAFPIIVVVLRRLARRALSAAGLWQLRAVVVGSPESAEQAIGALLSEPALGYCITGVVPPSSLVDARAGGVWRSLLLQHGAEILILASHPLDGLEGATEALVRERVPFAVVPRTDGLPVHGLERTRFFSHDTVMFSYKNNRAQPTSRALKMVLDLAVASTLVLLLCPIFFGIAVLVALDGGPVFYRHMRVGAGGRLFPCLKFRSMVCDGDAVLRRTLAADPAAAAEWRATRKLKSDPRVTWVGRTLRSTSLDELPQLLNILRLEMSLVGPRPVVEAELARYGEDVVYYFETRPGLTGLWQVSGRSETGYDQRVRLDTWYVKNWTIWHDLAILAKTIPAVLARRGAV